MSAVNGEIVDLARTVSGAGEAEEALLAALCAAAERRWTERLRRGVTAEDCGGAFVCAAAFTAAADLAAGRGGISAFTAGPLSVREEGGADRAAALRRAAEGLMAPYAEAADFSFKGVRG